MVIPRAQPSSSKIKKTSEAKKIILKKRATGGLKTASLNLDKSIVSYEPKVETTSGSKNIVQTKYSPMERALEVRANLGSKFPSFVKNMLPSHVAGGFWLGLPKCFCNLHMPKHDETIVLVDENEIQYETKYLVEKTGLSAGWRGFSIAHNLMENDVLVFHLIQPCKFKVYIVRANVFTDIDGAIGLLKLDACVKEIDIDEQEKDLKTTKMAREKHLEPHYPDHDNEEKEMVALSNEDTTADQAGENTDDYGSEDSEGIRFSQSVVDFKDVKSFKYFHIVVDGLIVDCKIPQHLRVKYYELCCHEKSYLHDQLANGLNLKLIAGVILETTNIADAIRSSKLTTSREDLKTWDITLKAFEGLGMKVGFLRARINKLVSLSSEYEDALKSRSLEKVKVEEELKALEIKHVSMKDAISNLDAEIDILKMKGEKLEGLFMEEAKAPL